MKKINISKIIILLLVSVLTISLIPSGKCEAATIGYTDEINAYYKTTSDTQEVVIEVTGLNKKQKITAVTSSNVNVVQPYRIYKSIDTYKTIKVSSDSLAGSDVSSYAGIVLTVKGVGKASVSFKIGSKTYKTSVNIKAFSNPLKSVKITGIESSANFTNKITWDSVGTYSTANTDASGSKLKLSTNSGWRVVGVSFVNETTGYTKARSVTSSSASIKSYKLGKIRSGCNYRVSIYLRDSNDNEETVEIYINSSRLTVVDEQKI